jgi:glutathione S-transferase
MFHDEQVLSESGAILFYFAQNTPLFPADAWGQAQVLRWMFFEQYSHEPYIAVNRHLRLHSSPAELARLGERIAGNHTRGEQALRVMEQQLSGNDWLAAGRYTIADIALYAYTHSAAEGGFDLAPYPGIRRWLDGVATQPGHIPQMREEAGIAVVRWPG